MINHEQSIDVPYRKSRRPSKDCNEKARNRWLLLAHALRYNKENVQSNGTEVSVRRFHDFGLFSVRPLSTCNGFSWFDYSTNINNQNFTLKVSHVSRLLTPADLMGFNNTGNVCVWPSEEVLAYYCLSNGEMFRNKSVMELGGGMTCLAGVMLAKFARPRRVLLTDGNSESVQNVRAVINANDLDDQAEACVLQWNRDGGTFPANFDFVLAADCLFFDETRMDLVATIWNCLKECATALITAPARGETHSKFLDAAQSVGFVTSLHPLNYNVDVFQRHTELKSSCPVYEEDIHYPLLISLYKPSSIGADYWKSQERKFCDFCKCWISNNKPSVQFHENGKKHQENVARRIAEIRKKSAKDHERKLEINKDMEQMEQAAMLAYLKDIESNPDFTSKVIKEEVAKAKAEKNQRLKEAEAERAKEKPSVVETETKPTPDVSTSKKWYEARSPEGYTYYWHVDTGESKWEPPEEGYLTVEEQLKETEEQKKLEEKKKEEEDKKRAELELRKRKLEIEKANERTKHLPSYGPASRPARPDPYGGWESVKTEEEEPVDLQLPEQDYVELNVPTLQSDMPKIEFKEKTVTSLSNLVQDNIKQESGVSAFKKRKINFKGNTRQRLDND